MLDSLSEFCGTINLTGLSTLEYLPTSDIDPSSYRFFSQGTTLMSVPLKAGKKWLTLPILPQSDNEQFFNESPNADGTITVDINCIFPVNTRQSRKALTDMRTLEKFVVRLVDRNGEKIIIGSLPYPLVFSAAFQSNRSAFTLRFSGKQPRLALGYNF